MTCRSSAGCQRDAGHGLWGKFCPEHATELAEIRTRWDGRDSIFDAVAVAHAVLGAGHTSRDGLRPATAHLTGPQVTKAVDLAVAQGWISTKGGVRPGATLPPGLTFELQALVLAQDLHDGNDAPETVEAGVLAVAVDRGWLTADLEPGRVSPSIPIRWSLTKRDRRKAGSPTAIPAKAEKRDLRRERATTIVEIVKQSGGRASRRELAEALGVAPSTAAEAAAIAVADGRLVSRSGSAKAAGYYLADAA